MSRPRTALVIPAAGTGSRFGAGMPKQFLALGGEPILLRTLQAFAGAIDHAVLAVSDEWRTEVAAIAVRAPFPCRLVAGGATRQASVHAGLRATDPACDLVLVHDAVRPLVPRRCIDACLDALGSHPAAVVGVPCAATIKRVTDTGIPLVETTVPREHLWLAQTPQGFRRDVGLAAFDAAELGGIQGTDDVQLIEQLGLSVALVPGDAANLKITTPDDLLVAEAVWQLRQRG